MAFSQFKSLGETALQYTLRVVDASFIEPIADIEPNEFFLTRFRLVHQSRIYASSEAARCETLIYPILQEVWQHYSSSLKLWSHAPLVQSEILSGTPDYLFAQHSEYGSAVMGKPIFVAVEAKQDDFAVGWGQCAAEMVAAQRINADATTVFGIVTNGEIWQFAKLEGNIFTQELAFYAISDLSKLFGALTFVMEECYKQAQKPELASLATAK